MKVFVFGNPIVQSDRKALDIAKRLERKVPKVNFIIVNENEDLPFIDENNVIILDVVEGIKKITLINEKSIDKLVRNKSISVHDWDLGFQLKYLKKLGMLKKITIIGLPMGKNINYLRIQSILRKLVEQEIHGS